MPNCSDYKFLFDTSKDGIVFLAKAQTITGANPAFCELLGYEHSELEGLAFKKLLPLKWTETIEKIWIEIDDKQIAEEFEIECIHKNGNLIPVNIKTWPVKNENGLSFVYLLMVTDITQKKLLQQRLYQSHKMETVGQLAAGMAHQLNTPLTVIKTRMKIIANAIDDEKLLKQAMNIDENVDRMADIIQNLLGFSRNADQFYESVDINKLIQTVNSLLETQLKKNNIEFITQLDPDLRAVFAIKTKIEQVLLNLLINAMDAIHTNGKITVITKNMVYKGQECVMISASDTGDGIPDKIKNHIFDPFFTTKPPGKGTGLGLFICNSIVQEHDGTIFVTSMLYEGTTFTVLLPIARGKDVEPRF